MSGGFAVPVIVILVGLAVFIAYVSTKPDRFRIQRSAVIRAPASRIFPLIEDLRRMNGWNPFDRKEPGAEGTYSGPAAGRGARYVFSGPKSGTGHIEITDTTAPTRVAMRLVMTKPFPADNVVEFALASEGSTTRVVWSMEGPIPFPAKLAQIFLNTDAMIGREFDTGLAALAKQAEAA